MEQLAAREQIRPETVCNQARELSVNLLVITTRTFMKDVKGIVVLILSATLSTSATRDIDFKAPP